jgi:hypothetical protein
MKLDTYIIITEISTAHFIDSSNQAVVARQRLGKNITAAMNTRDNKIILDTFFMRYGSYRMKVGD